MMLECLISLFYFPPGSGLGVYFGSYSVEKASMTQIFPVVASKHEVGGSGLAKEEVGQKM